MRLTLPYITPDMHCTDRRYECDGGIMSEKALCFRLSVCSVGLSGQILLPRFLVNGLSSLDETVIENSLVPIDDLLIFWRSKVKVRAGRRGGESIHYVESAMSICIL